jgi:membrane protein
VLLMWLYFSAAVLLLGAEFSAARGRMHDPRGAWGFGHAAPPCSRAKLASLLAASTIAANASPTSASAAASASARSGGNASKDDAKPGRRETGIDGTLAASSNASPRSQPPRSVRLGRAIVRYEDRATHAAATGLVQAGRAAEATDRYVRRHPWGSALLAAGAAITATAIASRHRHPETNESSPAADDR